MWSVKAEVASTAFFRVELFDLFPWGEHNSEDLSIPVCGAISRGDE